MLALFVSWESPRELAQKLVSVAEANGRKCSVSNRGDSKDIAAIYASFDS